MAPPLMFENHNYLIQGPDQMCHVCQVVEPPLRRPSGDEQTDRAAMHLVHKVTAHLEMKAKEWNA